MVAPNTFSIIQGELVIRVSSTGEILWKGKPYGINVDYVFTIPDSTDILVLLDWGANYTLGKNNLLRLDVLGNVIWVVGSPPIKSPPGPDRDDKNMQVYTGITAIDVNFVVAFAYSGYSDVIDIHTGKILKSIFVK